MASLDEISQRIERRLEELREESARLRAALDELGRDDALASRRLHGGRTTKPVVNTVRRSGPVKAGSGSAVALSEPNAAVGDDATQDAPVDRAIRQLRQELAAGLRCG
jgi:hypothetical protein